MEFIKEAWALLTETPDERRMRHQRGAVVKRPKQPKYKSGVPLETHPLTGHPDDQHGFDGIPPFSERQRKKRKA